MAYIVIVNLVKATIDGVIAKLRLVIDKMTGNANFPAPNPPLSELETIHDDLVTLKNDVKALRTSIAEKEAQIEAKIKLAKEKLQTEASHVQDIVRNANDGSLANNAGFELQGPASNTPDILDIPTKVRLREYKSSSGILQVLFDVVPHAKFYHIYFTYDISDPDSWNKTPIVATSSRNVILALAKGKTVWVRIKAYGTGNAQSDYSDIATRIVP